MPTDVLLDETTLAQVQTDGIGLSVVFGATTPPSGGDASLLLLLPPAENP